MQRRINVHLLPALIIAFRRNEKLKGQGLIIGGAITFLLNAACAGLVAGQGIGG